jgi:hypothetical protein
MAMIDIFAPIFFFLILCLWLVTALQGTKAYRAFLSKYPQEAEKLIPYAFSNSRHPEKFFFFFRKSSIPLLKGDANVWKQRQRFKWLLIISLVLPIMACIFGAIMAVLFK